VILASPLSNERASPGPISTKGAGQRNPKRDLSNISPNLEFTTNSSVIYTPKNDIKLTQNNKGSIMKYSISSKDAQNAQSWLKKPNQGLEKPNQGLEKMNTEGGTLGVSRKNYLKKFEKQPTGKSEQIIVTGKSAKDPEFQDELLQLLAENQKLGFLGQDLGAEGDSNSVSNTASGGTLGNSGFMGGKDLKSLKDENAMLRSAVEKLVGSKVSQTQHL
jgi:hypothetical protein